MEFTMEEIANLSEERRAEGLPALIRRLEHQIQEVDQEAVRLEQAFQDCRDEFSSLTDEVSDGRRAEIEATFLSLQRRADSIKQDRDSFYNELASMGFQAIAARHNTREQTLNPAIWCKLPQELQQVVFAHLSLRRITRLRTLSKTWDQYITGLFPGFTKQWADANPKIFGMLCEGHDYHDAGILAVRVYDTDSKKWHRFKHYSLFEEFIETMHAGDGGLVCIVPLAIDKERLPLSIVVVNPLTGHWRKLPEVPDALRSVQPSMVQLVMDRESKAYRVLVVGERDGHGGEKTASVYSSVSGQWSNAEDSMDFIFGYCHSFHPVSHLFHTVDGRSPCVYDCASSSLVLLDELQVDDGGNMWRGPDGFPYPYAFVKDHLFVLHKESFQFEQAGVVEERQRICIFEYQAQTLLHWLRSTREWRWVKLRVHSCGELEDPASGVHPIHLHACSGSLLACAENGDVAWSYEFSSGKWQTISGLPVKEATADELEERVESTEGEMTMFELQWDAVP